MNWADVHPCDKGYPCSHEEQKLILEQMNYNQSALLARYEAVIATAQAWAEAVTTRQFFAEEVRALLDAVRALDAATS